MLVHRAAAVGVGDTLALALGVVVDVRDEGCPQRLAVALGAAQVHLHALQQVGFAEARANGAVVRRSGLHCAVERIETGVAGVDLAVQRYRALPVERGLVVAGQLALALQWVAFEVERLAGDHAGLVEHLHRLAAQVGGFWVGLGLAVNRLADQFLGERLGAGAFLQPGFTGAMQFVVSGAEAMATAVPAYKGWPATSASIQRAPASMLIWCSGWPSMSCS